MESPYLIKRREQMMGRAAKDEPKAKKGLKEQSEKTKKETPEYKKFKAEFLARPENKYCVIKIDKYCTKIATTINHIRRRGKKNKMNPNEVEACCYYCNGKIEEKDAWAREHGHLKSKHEKVKPKINTKTQPS